MARGDSMPSPHGSRRTYWPPCSCSGSRTGTDGRAAACPDSWLTRHEYRERISDERRVTHPVTGLVTRVRRSSRRNPLRLYRRIRDSQLLEVRLVSRRIVIVFPHLRTVPRHDVAIQPDRRLVRRTNERGILALRRLDGPEEVP